MGYTEVALDQVLEFPRNLDGLDGAEVPLEPAAPGDVAGDDALTQTIADALCERMLPTRLSIRKTQQTILPSCLNWTTNIRMLLQTLNAQRFCSPTAWSSAIFLNRNCFRLLQIFSDCFTMYSGNISSRGGTLSGFLIFILPPRGNFLILWGCLLSDWMSL